MARIQRIQDDLQRSMRVEIAWNLDHTRFDRSASRITPRNTSGADPVANGSLKHIIITILIIFIQLELISMEPEKMLAAWDFFSL